MEAVAPKISTITSKSARLPVPNVFHPGTPDVYAWTKRLFEISLAEVGTGRGERI